MKKIISTAVAGLAFLAFPLVAADAKPGKGRGGPPPHAGQSDGYNYSNSFSDSGEGNGRQTGPPVDDSEQTDPPSETREQRRKARKCKRGRKVGFSVRGTLAGATDEDVTITVERANKHARSFIEGDTHTFALDGARVKFEGVADADADGDVDFADVAPTDRVKATGKVIRPKRGCDEAEPTVTLRKIHVERPEADEDEGEGEETES